MPRVFRWGDTVIESVCPAGLRFRNPQIDEWKKELLDRGVHFETVVLAFALNQDNTQIPIVFAVVPADSDQALKMKIFLDYANVTKVIWCTGIMSEAVRNLLDISKPLHLAATFFLMDSYAKLETISSEVKAEMRYARAKLEHNFLSAISQPSNRPSCCDEASYKPFHNLAVEDMTPLLEMIPPSTRNVSDINDETNRIFDFSQNAENAMFGSLLTNCIDMGHISGVNNENSRCTHLIYNQVSDMFLVLPVPISFRSSWINCSNTLSPFCAQSYVLRSLHKHDASRHVNTEYSIRKAIRVMMHFYIKYLYPFFADDVDQSGSGVPS